MIAEAFLICALSPTPAMAFGNQAMSNGAEQAHRVLVKSAEFIHYGKQLSRSRFLVVGGDPSLVTTFRQTGLKAFGAFTEDVPGITIWHAIANTTALSFGSKVFSGVYWLHENFNRNAAHNELREAVRMVTPNGYLLFNDMAYENWPVILTQWGWHQMPFRWLDYTMWIRPDGGNPRKTDKLKESA